LVTLGEEIIGFEFNFSSFGI